MHPVVVLILRYLPHCSAAVYFRHCLEDLGGQAAALQRHVERLETVTLDAISLEVRSSAPVYPVKPRIAALLACY